MPLASDSVASLWIHNIEQLVARNEPPNVLFDQRIVTLPASTPTSNVGSDNDILHLP